MPLVSVQGLTGLILVSITAMVLTLSFNMRRLAPSGQQPFCSQAQIYPPMPPGAFFVIWGPDFSPFSGGAGVLHGLADRLNRRYASHGEAPVAYLHPWDQSHLTLDLTKWNTNPGYAAPVLPAWMDPKDGIAVYAEGAERNVLGAKKVVRWMLYFSPLARNYDENELVACYSLGFCEDLRPGRDRFLLRLTEHEWDTHQHLPAPEGNKRNGTIVLHKKKEMFTGKQHYRVNEGLILPGLPQPVIELNRTLVKRKRMELFARAELFVTYDPMTFIAVEAALVGCPVVVVPLPGLSRQEWRERVGPMFWSGIAYGMEELEEAKRTLPDTTQYIKKLRAEEEDQLSELVERITAKWYTNSTQPSKSGT